MATTNLKVLFILPEYYPHSGGGISTYYLHYIKALEPYVKEIKVIVGSGYTQSIQKYDLDGVTIEYLQPRLYQNQLKKFSRFDLLPEYEKNIAAAWAMWEQASQGNQFDLIECTDFGLGFIPWLVHHKTPVITRLHGSSGQIELFEPHLKEGLLGDLFRQTELNLLQYADRLITHSVANQTFWKNILNQEVTHIPPVFFQSLTPDPELEKDYFGIVAGRIQQWKGPDILCKAVQELCDLDILIKWYGKDTNYDNKDSKSIQLKKDYPAIWGTKIVAYKPIEHTKLLLIQQKARYAVIPSTWDMYNFTGLEYILAGTVLICSDGAGVSELIEDGINGFKYQKEDHLALANCIRKVLALSKNEYDTIVINASNTLTNKLSTTALIETNLSEYKNAGEQFAAADINVYHVASFQPTETEYFIDGLLDKQPLKRLISYLFKRIRKKI